MNLPGLNQNGLSKGGVWLPGWHQEINTTFPAGLGALLVSSSPWGLVASPEPLLVTPLGSETPPQSSHPLQDPLTSQYWPPTVGHTLHGHTHHGCRGHRLPPWPHFPSTLRSNAKALL